MEKRTRICIAAGLASLVLNLEPCAAGDDLITRVLRAPLNIHISTSSYDPSPYGHNRFSYVAPYQVIHEARLDPDELEILRAGIGMDMTVSEFCNLHMNLYSRDGDPHKGKRWTLGSFTGKAPVISRKVWSFGGTIFSKREDVSHFGITPQVMANLDDVLGKGSKTQIIFEYRRWDSGSLSDRDHSMPQLHVKWVFGI